ncbi:PREDICTED: sushi domain-containing protein 2-like isoform X2 [Cyprinodon variegatus]|uniref:sushi domain-containing protein 2-like isoform X2 n=1 Tax=Cyprinodon variegatus TaxID=28743 RepID=UPI000742542C|nr:PREDICTED: sushi domain-containing protein 2-like isoform X2 [Cyprinodon variegatus]
MSVYLVFSNQNMGKNRREFIFLWIILIFFSSKTSGLTCRRRCGSTLEECSCQETCLSLKNCCSDYNQSCFNVSPYSSSMLGGRALRILGLTLPSDGHLLCRFKGDIEQRGVIDEEGRPYCISPLLLETGWISIDVSTDGTNFDRSGEYLSVYPSKADPSFKVTLVNSTLWQNYGTPNMAGQLRMTWNSSLVGSEKIDVELWGYREVSRTVAGLSAPQAEIRYLYSLGRNIPNTGDFSFLPEPREEFSLWELGNIRITASSKSEGERNLQALWSEGHVLAWHLSQAFRDDSSRWAQKKCLQWDNLEKKLPNFLDELIPCPCTLAQARADTGRFHTDYSCNIETGSVCTYHPGSVHCVRAIQASSNHGSGQQCCYDHSGALVLTGDSVGGSTPDRAHNWGSPPYREPPQVPGYSHWLYDVTSFCYCCLWSDLCHIYLNHRPSSGCRRYQPPRAGVVFGNLHFITFDGLSYTFSGRGEYYLVSSGHRELRVQARTTQLKLKNGTLVNATKLSSVAMKENSSDVIEVRAAGDQLQVLRNQKILPFTDQLWMTLQGVFVFAPCPQNVTVTFSSGAAVEVRLYEGTMIATVLLPVEFSNHTLGLLGQMNSDPSDDLMTQSGKVVSSANSTPEEIFTFGAGWNISKMSSLFTYDSQYLLDSYFFPSSHDTAFVPAFPLPLKPDDPLVADMLLMCLGEGAQFCIHDTLISESLAVGNATLRAHQHHQDLMEALEPVVSCGWLPTPRNGKKNGTNYLQGETLGFTCNEGYILYRSTERTCLAEGKWTGKQPYCITDDKLGFILGACGCLSAVVTMTITIKLHNRKHTRKDKEEPLEMVGQAQT